MVGFDAFSSLLLFARIVYVNIRQHLDCSCSSIFSIFPNYCEFFFILVFFYCCCCWCWCCSYSVMKMHTIQLSLSLGRSWSLLFCLQFIWTEWKRFSVIFEVKWCDILLMPSVVACSILSRGNNSFVKTMNTHILNYLAIVVVYCRKVNFHPLVICDTSSLNRLVVSLYFSYTVAAAVVVARSH